MLVNNEQWCRLIAPARRPGLGQTRRRIGFMYRVLGNTRRTPHSPENALFSIAAASYMVFVMPANRKLSATLAVVEGYMMSLYQRNTTLIICGRFVGIPNYGRNERGVAQLFREAMNTALLLR